MNYEDLYLESFNNFINQLKIIYIDDDIQKILTTINEYQNTKKIYNGLYFSSLIDDEHFDLLINNKIKLFSHKNVKTQEISESLFGKELCIKNILNNQPDDVKNIIWFNLHSLYSTIEKTKSDEIQNKDRLEIINKLICNPENKKYNISPNETKNKLKELLNVDINDDTSEMIEDIIKSFESVVNNNNNVGGTQLNGIMGISQKISLKYNDKINNGDIELDKIMASITKKVPGMEQMMNNMTGGSFDIKDMMSTLLGGKKDVVKNKILIDENFSTSTVDVGIIDEKSSNMKIGNILKMADNFGIIPGGKKSNDEPSLNNSQDPQDSQDFEKLTGSVPNIGKMMNMMQKLTKTTTIEDAEQLKEEMSTFLQNNLGIDINTITQQLESAQMFGSNNSEESIEHDKLD
jgi:hypothetical protein